MTKTGKYGTRKREKCLNVGFLICMAAHPPLPTDRAGDYTKCSATEEVMERNGNIRHAKLKQCC